MLLRHTASALALAATLSLSNTSAPSTATDWARTSAPTNVSEVGGGSSALICLGCVAAGVLTLATGGATTAIVTLLVGGAEAVALGGTLLTCTTACIAYLAD